jgi:hypothetical protein
MTRPDGPTEQNINQHKLNKQIKTFQDLKNINSITSYNDLTKKIDFMNNSKRQEK